MSEQDTQKIEEEVIEEKVLDAETEEIKKELGLDDEEDAEVEGDESTEETTEEEESTEEEVDSEDEEESSEDVEPHKKNERPVKTVPVAKFQGEKKKWQTREAELQKEIEKLKEKEPESKSVPSKDLKELADEYGVDEEFVSKLADNIVSKTALPKEDKEKLDYLTKKYESEKADEQFNSAVQSLQDEYPDEPIGDYKDKIKELAYAEGHTTESAFELYFRHIKPTVSTTKKTAEKSRSNGEISKEVTDFDDPNLDTEDLSDEEFDKFTELQASKEKLLEIRK